MPDAGPKLLRGLLEVFILESLEQSPKHGYALLKEMTEAFGQEPNRNRLYPLLGRLVRDGYVREVSESGGNRTLYALTDEGRDALRAYRRLPGAFRQALRRIWSVDAPGQGARGHAAGLGSGPRAPRADPVEGAPPAGPSITDDLQGPPQVAPAAAAPAPTAARQVPIQLNAPTTAPIPMGAPYPCADARVSIDKDPRTGGVTIRVTGCPIGTFSYCGECPVSKSLAGLKGLIFPV